MSFEKTSACLAADSQDYWSQDRGYLIRHRMTARTQAFQPNEVDYPVDLERVSSWRRTVAELSDGHRLEHEDKREPQGHPLGQSDWNHPLRELHEEDRRHEVELGR